MEEKYDKTSLKINGTKTYHGKTIKGFQGLKTAQIYPKHDGLCIKKKKIELKGRDEFHTKIIHGEIQPR